MGRIMSLMSTCLSVQLQSPLTRKLHVVKLVLESGYETRTYRSDTVYISCFRYKHGCFIQGRLSPYHKHVLKEYVFCNR